MPPQQSTAKMQAEIEQVCSPAQVVSLRGSRSVLLPSSHRLIISSSPPHNPAAPGRSRYPAGEGLRRSTIVSACYLHPWPLQMPAVLVQVRHLCSMRMREQSRSSCPPTYHRPKAKECCAWPRCVRGWACVHTWFVWVGGWAWCVRHAPKDARVVSLRWHGRVQICRTTTGHKAFTASSELILLLSSCESGCVG